MKAADFDLIRLEMAKYFVETQGTIRLVAKKMNVPKSTVHYNLKRFIECPLNYSLARQVQELIEKNKQERHMRGGMALKTKLSKL